MSALPSSLFDFAKDTKSVRTTRCLSTKWRQNLFVDRSNSRRPASTFRTFFTASWRNKFEFCLFWTSGQLNWLLSIMETGGEATKSRRARRLRKKKKQIVETQRD